MMDHAVLADALEGVLGPIDTQEAAAAAVEAVCRALGCRPDSDPSRLGTAHAAIGSALGYLSADADDGDEQAQRLVTELRAALDA